MQLVGNHVQDMNTQFVDTMERIDGLEASFTQKLDAKFQEMMARLPLPAAAAPQPAQVRRARHVPRHGPPAAVGAAALDDSDADYYGADEYMDESEEVLQHPPGRPRANNPHARHLHRPLIRGDDNVAKLKLNIPPFEGHYNPDVYLSLELEVEQLFACLACPDDKRVSAATCEFTSFASIWWSEYCHLHHANPPTT
jgi:hypothetical protein